MDCAEQEADTGTPKVSSSGTFGDILVWIPMPDFVFPFV